MPRTKTLKNIGEHPICDLWEGGDLCRQIIAAVDSAKCSSIDVLRIGYRGLGEKEDQLPVVLWIGVLEGSLDWRHAIKIVKACVSPPILRRTASSLMR